eukprot:21448-Amphidinium_carterae.1
MAATCQQVLGKKHGGQSKAGENKGKPKEEPSKGTLTFQQRRLLGNREKVKGSKSTQVLVSSCRLQHTVEKETKRRLGQGKTFQLRCFVISWKSTIS